MKGKVKRLLAIGFAFTLLATGSLSSAAAENTVLSEKFTDPVSFVAMGDLNCDGSLASSDLVMLRKILLGTSNEGSRYADSTTDNKVNLKDLVRLKKDIAALKKPAFIENGVLNLNGTAYYNGELVSLLKANTEYQISYNVESEKGITITVSGAKNGDAVYNSGTGSKYFSHILKTGDSLTVNSGLELSVSGVGKIDNIIINEITDNWSDGDTAEQGGNDIF